MTKAGPPGLRLAGGILLAIGLTIAVAAEFRGWPAPDLEWLLHIAGRVLDGNRLYVDLLEVNPPLIVGLNLPAVALGRALGVPPVTIYRIGVVAIAVMSLLLAARVLPFTTEADRVRCRRVVALLAAGFLIVPGLTFGQRDHLALILTAPYVLLRIAQALETPEPRWARLVAAGLAGIGVALKPHFLVFWLAVEAWSVAKRGRRPGRLLNLENLVIGGTLLAYAGAVVTFTPEYLALVRELGDLYLQFYQDGFLYTLALGDGFPAAAFAILAWAALRRVPQRSAWWSGLAAGTAGFLAAGVLQQKGFRYHATPALGLGLVLSGLLALEARPPFRSWLERIYWSAAVAAVFATLTGSALAALRRARDPTGPGLVEREFRPMVDFLSREATGRPVLMLSPNIMAFPLVSASGAVWVSRWPCLWFLPALYRREMRLADPLRLRAWDRADPLERGLIASVVDDLTRSRPELVVVLRPGPDRPEAGGQRFDLLAWLGRHPAFAGAFASYHEAGQVGKYVVYSRRPLRHAALLGPATAPVASGSDWFAARGLLFRGADPRWRRTAIALLVAFAMAWWYAGLRTEEPHGSG